MLRCSLRKGVVAAARGKTTQATREAVGVGGSGRGGDARVGEHRAEDGAKGEHAEHEEKHNIPFDTHARDKQTTPFDPAGHCQGEGFERARDVVGQAGNAHEGGGEEREHGRDTGAWERHGRERDTRNTSRDERGKKSERFARDRANRSFERARPAPGPDAKPPSGVGG